MKKKRERYSTALHIIMHVKQERQPILAQPPPFSCDDSAQS